MEALILSCSTGGGHNTAAQAVAEELSRRGHTVTTLDPYQLVGDKLAITVGNAYVKLVQKVPFLFGIIYKIGNAYQRLPIHSPVYWVNGRMIKYLHPYLQEHHFDTIVSTHIFPGEILAHMRADGITIPNVVLIATDYTCIPFTEETACDYFMVASTELLNEFSKKGTPKEKIIPCGIPVRKEFQNQLSQEEAKEALHLERNKRYILLSGGSIGAGEIKTAIQVLEQYLDTNKDTRLIVLCGNNQKLYVKLRTRYADNAQISILKSTSKMAAYMKACDLFISKPGGLSSTEGAALGIPMILISPIPGCESRNAEFYSKHGLALFVRNIKKELLHAVKFLQNEENVEKMRQQQKQYIDGKAVVKIGDFIEDMVESQ